MAGRGPAPKATRSRARDTEKRDAQMETVTGDGELHGKPLPNGVLPDGDEWHPQTLALWNALRRWPLLAEESELGWQFLVDTMLMHHTMWAKGKWEFASEVRLRLAKYGATPEDRMRLKVKVETPRDEPAGPRPASAAAERRRGLRIAE